MIVAVFILFWLQNEFKRAKFTRVRNETIIRAIPHKLLKIRKKNGII